MCGGSSLLSIENTINALNGSLTVACNAPAANGSAHCSFQQTVLESLFGSQGLGLDGCAFGECVRQSVIDASRNTVAASEGGGADLSKGVIAGLVVVGALIGLLLALLVWGFIQQRNARRGGGKVNLGDRSEGVGVEWDNLQYMVPIISGTSSITKRGQNTNREKIILDHVNGRVKPGSMMAILGPSGESYAFRVLPSLL
jgi:ABC-type multidrug transport system fused ATPase/permease subunit